MGSHIFIQVSSNLAENLKWMAWNGAWHAANLLSGDDATSDKEKEKEYFNKIGRDDPGTDSGEFFCKTMIILILSNRYHQNMG